MLKNIRLRIIGLLVLFSSLTACSYNPMNPNSTHQLTGNVTGTAVGAVAGTATGMAFGLPNSLIATLGLSGGAIGYYATTERFAAGGILQSGGQVYSLGDYTTIDIPTDSLFEPNSCDFLPGYEPTLLSVVNVLNRSPANNVLISGNTSGFGSPQYERRLSEARARKIANYLWANGISSLSGDSNDHHMRKVRYVGYGDYFPIANHIRAESLRQNSRIQITSYPTRDQLYMSKKMEDFNNIGGMGEEPAVTSKSSDGGSSGTVLAEQTTSDNGFNEAFKD